MTYTQLNQLTATAIAVSATNGTWVQFCAVMRKSGVSDFALTMVKRNIEANRNEVKAIINNIQGSK